MRAFVAQAILPVRLLSHRLAANEAFPSRSGRNAKRHMSWTKLSMLRKKLEARGGIEPTIKVLQTFALPLGDRAPTERSIDIV